MTTILILLATHAIVGALAYVWGYATAMRDERGTPSVHRSDIPVEHWQYLPEDVGDWFTKVEAHDAEKEYARKMQGTVDS